MPDSVRLRVLNAITAELGATPKVAATIGKDRRGWEQLNPSDLPAVYVIARSGGDVQGQPSRQIREDMSVLVVGLVKSATGGIDGVAEARETLYQTVLNRLEGAGMQARLDQDLQANAGAGAIRLQHSAAPDVDEGESPPYGFFALPCSVLLHYTRGAL